MNIKEGIKDLEGKTIYKISFNDTDNGEIRIDFLNNTSLTLTPSIIDDKPRIKAQLSYIVTDTGYIRPMKEEE